MKRLIQIFLILPMLLIIVCDEQEVPYYSDEDELERYLRETEEGRELFRSEGIFGTVSYPFRFDSATFIDSLVASRQVIKSISISGPHDFGNLGSMKEALVTIEDQMDVLTLRVFDGDTTSLGMATRLLTRYAYFLKLLDDSFPFLGWKLYGFNSFGGFNGPVNVDVRTIDSRISFIGDLRAYSNTSRTLQLPYIKLEDIPELNQGDSLVIQTDQISPGDGYHFMSGETNNGFITEAMYRISDEAYIDTLATPSSNDRFWNIIVLHSFVEKSPIGQHIKSWCIPYRVK